MFRRLLHKSLAGDRLWLLRGWVAVLAAVAISLSLGLVAAGYRVGSPITTGALALLAIAAESEAIQLAPAFEVSVASLVCIFAAVVCGPLSAALVGAVGLLVILPKRDTDRPVMRWLAWTSIRITVSAVAGLVANAIAPASETGFWLLFVAVGAALVSESALDLNLSLIAPWIRGTSPWGEALKSLAPAMLGTLPIQAPFIAVLAYSYRTISPWSVVFFAIPGVAAHRLFRLYREQRKTAHALTEANARLASANLSFATALVATLDARDQYTAGHSAAVATYARDIAERMGLSTREQELAHLCGLVHDVGKIGLPPGLLEKTAALTLDERRQMEQHSEIGERILRNVDDYAEIAAVVRHHHERVDGNGYPDRLCGDEIPLLARIISVADAYNAMTSDRPYRDAMPSRVARLRLAQAVESQFDTAVVAAFEAILTASSEAYRMGEGQEFKIAHPELPIDGAAPLRQQELEEELHALAAGAAAVTA